MTNEVMTEAESLIRIDMLTRERDAAKQEADYHAHWSEKWETVCDGLIQTVEELSAGFAAQFTQRPGYQNGMAKLEEMEARRG